MSVNRLWTIPLAFVAAAIVVLAPAAARDRKPPRIVAAAMVDANGDFRADRVRLTYSERIRHAADRDGHYPVAVVGYRIRSLATATGRTLLVFLVEKKTPDGKAQPAVRYRRTTSKPVRDRAGNQALAQLFRGVRAHAHTPPLGAGLHARAASVSPDCACRRRPRRHPGRARLRPQGRDDPPRRSRPPRPFLRRLELRRDRRHRGGRGFRLAEGERRQPGHEGEAEARRSGRRSRQSQPATASTSSSPRASTVASRSTRRPRAAASTAVTTQRPGRAATARRPSSRGGRKPFSPFARTASSCSC